MKRFEKSGLAAAVLVVGAAVVLVGLSRPKPVGQPISEVTRALPSNEESRSELISPARPEPSPATEPAGIPGKMETSPVVPNPLSPPPAADVSALASAISFDPGGVIAADLERIQFALRDYRTALGGNPAGTNSEITRALLGDNLKQVKLEVPEGSQVNGQAELCDRWGSPYFFHQLSATAMEVRSAGPDRKMWTADDFLEK